MPFFKLELLYHQVLPKITYSSNYFPYNLLFFFFFFRANLKLVKEMGDHQAQGRTIGNLGNTHYLLGNYKKSIRYHEEVSEGGGADSGSIIGDEVSAVACAKRSTL